VILLHEPQDYVGSHFRSTYGERLRTPKVPNETKNVFLGTLLRIAEELLASPHDTRVDVSSDGCWRYFVRQLEHYWGGFPLRYGRKLTKYVLLTDEAATDPELPDAGKQEFLDHAEIIVEKAIESVSVPLHRIPVRPPEGYRRSSLPVLWSDQPVSLNLNYAQLSCSERRFRSADAARS
jgi:hypothetical protein